MERTAEPPFLRYDPVAAFLHWLIVLMVIPLVFIGIFHDSIGGMGLHQSLGLTVFVLMALRLLWRIGHAPPPLFDHVPDWQERIALATHYTFYAMLLIMPITGYLFTSAGRHLPHWWGVQLPATHLSKGLAGALHLFHQVGGFFIAGVIVLHIGAALYHQYMLKDRLIARMWPFGASR